MKRLEQVITKECVESLGNVLEPVTMGLYPEVDVLKEQMKKFGADAVLMSGSGPTVFGLVEHESRVPRIYNGLKGFCPRSICNSNDWVNVILLIKHVRLW